MAMTSFVLCATYAAASLPSIVTLGLVIGLPNVYVHVVSHVLGNAALVSNSLKERDLDR